MGGAWPLSDHGELSVPSLQPSPHPMLARARARATVSCARREATWRGRRTGINSETTEGQGGLYLTA